MREIIKKSNSSPESEATSTIKLNSSSTSSYIATGTSEPLTEECTNRSSSLDDGSPSSLELGCYQTNKTMVVKQEGAGLDIKPDPDASLAASPSVMNGEDSLKNNMFVKQNFDSKIKSELANGNITDTDLKPTVSDSGISGPNNTSITPSITPPQNVENTGTSTKCGTAGVATSDAQYMQQQSQIFVFTTELANKAAEETSNGTFGNIIQFHCSQTDTRKLLEKHPLKLNQFSKTNPAHWMNNVNMKGPKSATMKPQMGPSHMNEMGQMPPMVQSMTGPQSDPQMPPNMMMNHMGPNPPGSHMMGPGPHMGGMGMTGPPRGMMMHPSVMNNPMMPASMNPRMQGVRLSDDGLTPEQRKHREDQLSRIKDMATWLLPELGGPQVPTDGQPNAPSCMNSNAMPAAPQSNNNPGVAQVPSAIVEPSSNPLATQPCPTSNPCGMPTPNSCSMPGPCTGIMQDTNPASCSGPISDSCSSSMLPSAVSMSAGGPPACSNPAMNGNCGMPMSGNCPGPMPGPSCNNVITSPVPLQQNIGPGPSPCTQTSTAPCTMSATSSCPTNTSSGNPMSHSQPLSGNCPQNNMNIGQSPVPRMGSSPGLGHSPNMGPSPGMMGPGMPMGPGMMGPFGPMGSQQNMMMGQGPMGNAMMGPSQSGMMGNSMGPGGPPMRMMVQGNPMVMGGPNSSVVSQMDWQRSMAEQMELKRKKGQMAHDGPMAMMGPGPHMGGPMMGGHMMVPGPMHGNMGMMPVGMRQMGPGMQNPRMQGPPPPYHGPSPRSMGNGPLPSPGSPSMCSITSPRMANCPPNAMRLPGPSSGMDSPRPSCSNPATPVSSGSISSPSLSLKDQPQSVSNDMPFGRQLQNFAQQKQQGHMAPSCAQQMSHMPSNLGPGLPPEPSLMPVPSPQQIQYLNTFDGQELTIQKQPNTSLRDTDILSPLGGTLDNSNDNLTSLGNKASDPTTPQTGPSTPHTPLTDAGRYNNGPQTPDRFPVPSPGMAPPSTPHTPQQQNGQAAAENKANNSSRFGGPSPQSQSNSGNCGGPKTPSMDSRFPVPSPKTPGMCGSANTPIADPSTQRFHGASPLHSGAMNELNSIGKFPPTTTTSCQKMGSGFSPGKISGLEMGGEFGGQPTSNLPLDPVQGGMANIASKALDPISSMAQMSQQLGSTAQPGSPPIPSASTPTLPIGPMPIGAPGPTGPTNMIDNQVAMMGIPPVSSSPAMMGGPVPSPVSGGPRGASPSNTGMMPVNPGMMPGNPRMMMSVPRHHGPNGGIADPFNGTNVQVKSNAPSTMHYMPVRPQNNTPPGPRGPSSMEFISRFNSPVGLEKPVSPMFLNNTTPNSMCGPNVSMANMPMSGPCSGMGSQMCPTGPMGSMPGQIPGQNVPVVNNMPPMSVPSGPFTMNGPSGHVTGPNGPMGMGPNGPNGPMGMGPNGPMAAMGGPMGPNGHMMGPNGPMMGPNGPMSMNAAMMGNGPMGPNGQMMGPRGMSHMMRGPNPAAMMGPMANEMYAMSGPPGGMPGGGQMGPGPSGSGHPGPNQMMPGSAPMYASKGSPGMVMGSPMGATQDTAQPLPPSMGQSGNYKNSHFMVPTTADPNYAAQFHNFQQQLYATNTRVGPPMGPMGGPVGPGVPHGHVGPGMQAQLHMGHQFPFNPK